MQFIVYVLYSASADKHYTGFTSNLEERLLSHNFLGNGWTARHRPWKLIFTSSFENKKEAMAFEKWLKSGAGRDFINNYHTEHRIGSSSRKLSGLPYKRLS